MSEDKISADKIDESTMLKQIKNKLEEKNIPIETFVAEWERLENLEDDLTTVYMNGFYDGEKKWKDKIKDKIEFYKRYGKIKNSNEYVMSVEIEVLEELLEERN